MPHKRLRQERYLAKLKESPEKWKNYLENRRVKKREYRVRKKALLAEDSAMLTAKRKKDRARQALCRRKKREADKTPPLTPSIVPTPYKTRATFGKAVAKVTKALPLSPNKRKAVVLQIAKTTLLPEVNQKFQPLQKKSSNAISKESVNLIQEFYQFKYSIVQVDRHLESGTLYPLKEVRLRNEKKFK